MSSNVSAFVRNWAIAVALTAASIVSIPAVASAQSAIAGVVKDKTGAVLPGVSVEASSPALIEKTRVVTTDDQGRYRIVDLRPGVYMVRFTLQGFSSVAREDVELAAEAVLTMNADLAVGAMSETVTVTGQSATVDVQKATLTKVLTRAEQDELPTAKTFNSIAFLAPGVKFGTPSGTGGVDVGGSQATNPTNLAIRGETCCANNSYVLDGFSMNSYSGNQGLYFNESMGQEVTISTGNLGAETGGGGFRQNTVLRDGGNRVSVSAYLGGSDGTWLSKNISDEMIARNVRTGNSVSRIGNYNGVVGGPIQRDRLWYVFGTRFVTSSYRPPNQPDEVPLPLGGTMRTDSDDYLKDLSLRLTLQVSQTLKFSGFFERYYKQVRFVAGGADPMAVMFRAAKHARSGIGYLKLSWTPSNQWLVFGGISTAFQHVHNGSDLAFLEPARYSPDWYTWVRKTDTVLNKHWQCTLPDGCTAWAAPVNTQDEQGRYDARISAEHITGTHNIKIGMNYDFGPHYARSDPNGHLTMNYINHVPSTVTVTNAPTWVPERIKHDAAVFVQDSWTWNRLTFNPSVRVEWFLANVMDAVVEAGRFAPVRAIAGIDGPAYGPDVAPRFTVAYDLFGDSRTALRGGFSKYMTQLSGGAAVYSAANNSTESRNWFDCSLIPGTSTCSAVAVRTNGDDIAQDYEIGPSGSPNFGQPTFADRKPDPNLSRPYTLEATVGVQHQVTKGIIVGVDYIRRGSRDITLTDRPFISESDYLPFQTAMPSVATDPTVAKAIDPNALLTVYNLKPEKLSQFGVGLIDTNSSQIRSSYNGIESTFSARIGSRATVGGNWSMEKQVGVTCVSDDNPNATTGISNKFCDERPFHVPFRHQFKAAGAVALKYGIGLGAVFSRTPGFERIITYAVPANLFPGGRTQAQTIQINTPGTVYYPSWHMADVNVRKEFKVARSTLTAEFTLYNALNDAAILAMTNTVGASLGNVTTTLNGRTPRIAMSYRF